MVQPIKIRSKLILQEVIQPNSAGLRTLSTRFQEQVIRDVLVEIARIVAGEIAERIPRGHGSKMSASYSGLCELWAHWANEPVVTDEGVFIGNVAQMDEATRGQNGMASKKGSWRYGAWFNLEWGREWPHVGDSYVYQENPGPNKEPRMSAPPGAGPADIAMSKWLKITEHRSGEQSYTTVRKLGSENKNRQRSHRALVANWHHRTEKLRQEQASKKYAKRLTGQFGQAPIRLGYIAGLQIAEQRIPELLEKALRDATARR